MHSESIANVNTICRRSWYIATNIWKMYDFKIEAVPFIINLRRQNASETLPELGQAIRRLVNKTYPKAPAEVRETLSTEHFLDALVNSEMRIRIKQSRPANVNQAICLAVELYKDEKKNEFGRAHLTTGTDTDETKRYKDNKEDKLVEDAGV